VLIDYEAVLSIDSTAIAMLQRLRVDLREAAIWFGVARMKAPVRAVIARPLRDPVDRDRRYATVSDGALGYEAFNDPATSSGSDDAPRPGATQAASGQSTKGA
jgi:hypothetical protein